MDIQIKYLSELKQNPNNPRNITDPGIKRLTKQMLKLGIFKPWIVTPDDVVLGGNMRLKVARTIIEMNSSQLAEYMSELFVDKEGNADRDAILTIYQRLYPEVQESEIPFNFTQEMAEKIQQEFNQIPVSVISPRNDSVTFEYSLADNSQAGYYDEDLIANSMPNYNFEWKDYGIDFTPPQSANEYFQAKINAQADAQEKEDNGADRQKDEIQCPNCQFQFEV